MAVVERKLFGGTCVNVGCIPTKTLVASARAAYMARRAADFGVVIDGSIGVDMARVKERMKRVSGESNQGVTSWLEGLENVSVFRGHAQLKDERTVRVNGESLEADRIFLNVGARAFVPDMPGIDRVPYLTNSSIMEVDFLPEHLVIVGGSYIGLEFAQMYRRFGSRVTVIDRGTRVIKRDDPDVSEVVREVLESEGVEFRLQADCISVEKRGDGVAVGVDCQAGEPEVVGSHLLLAVGRVPNTEDLGLDRAKVQVDGRGFVGVDDEMNSTPRTCCPWWISRRAEARVSTVRFGRRIAGCR